MEKKRTATLQFFIFFSVLISCTSLVRSEILEVPAKCEVSGFGTSSPYRGQTFILQQQSQLDQVTAFLTPSNDSGFSFRILITEVDTTNGFHPSTVLFESETFNVPQGSQRGVLSFTANTRGVALSAGQSYAVIHDAFVTLREHPEVTDISITTSTGIDCNASYQQGYSFSLFSGLFLPSGTREEHFASNSWFVHDYPNHSRDLGFILKYTPVSLGNGTLPYYDTFDATNIDLSKWHDRVGDINDGKLWLEKQGAGAWSSTSLRMITANITDYFSSKVSIRNGSYTIGDSSVAVKVGGVFYNDTYNGSTYYNDWEGNIYADVRLQLYEGKLRARAVIVRYNNSNGSLKSPVSANFSQPIEFDTEYTLSIGLLGSSLVFSCNEEIITYQISTAIYPSNKLDRTLSTMVYADEGESGYIKGSFDDVCIAKSCFYAASAAFLPAVFLLLH